METDKSLYNRYQNEVADYEVFKEIKDKKLRKLLFTGWVSHFGSKEVRAKMNIPYSTYGYLVKTYGSSGSDTEDKPKVREKKEKKTVIDVEGYTYPLPTEPMAITDGENDQESRVWTPPAETTQARQAVKSPFISVEWTNTPETIKSQVEALANLLLFEKGELTLKLEVFKNN